MNDDPLSPLLTHFSARARVFYTGSLCGADTFDEAADVGFLHLLKHGRIHLRDNRGRVETLAEPTLLFYSRPLTHRIETDQDAGAELACASVAFDHQAFNPIALALPPYIRCALGELGDARALLDMLFSEAFANKPARNEVLNRLFELVLIQLMRATITRASGDIGFLRALSHPQLSRALTAMHSHPERDWSLEALAGRAAMSRSSFAELFRREVGQTAGEYLAGWRITTAQAFKQIVGRSPGQWLREQAGGSPDGA